MLLPSRTGATILPPKADLDSMAEDNLAAYLVRHLVGRRAGLIRRLVRVPRTPDGPRISQVGCELTVPTAVPNDVSIRCGGAGLSDAEAVIRCLGEAVERYCATLAPTAPDGIATVREMGEQAVDPRAFVLFSDAQYAQPGFPFIAPDADTPLLWVPARSLTDNSKRRMPAGMVYLPYQPTPPEPYLAPSISTGLACHTTPEAAALAGLLEVIERDAFSCVWLARISPPLIPRGHDFPAAVYLPFGCSFQAYNLTSDLGIPVALVVLRGTSPAGRTICIGTAAAMTIRQAANKALLEAAMSWTYAVWLHEHDPAWEPGANFEHVTQFPHHARLYTGRPELETAFDFLDRHPTMGPPFPDRDEETTSTESALETCVSHLKQAGFDVFRCDLTCAPVRALGLHVARILCPGLQPLHGHHYLPFLGAGRLWRVTDCFPTADVNPTPDTLNPYPHPSA